MLTEWVLVFELESHLACLFACICYILLVSCSTIQLCSVLFGSQPLPLLTHPPVRGPIEGGFDCLRERQHIQSIAQKSLTCCCLRCVSSPVSSTGFTTGGFGCSLCFCFVVAPFLPLLPKFGVLRDKGRIIALSGRVPGVCASRSDNLPTLHYLVHWLYMHALCSIAHYNSLITVLGFSG